MWYGSKSRRSIEADNRDEPTDADIGTERRSDRRQEADDEDMREGVFIESLERMDVLDIFAIGDRRLAQPCLEKTQHDASPDDGRRRRNRRNDDGT